LRWVALVLVLVLVITGLVLPALYDFAGGEDEWQTSGQSRLVLIERVLSVSMRNPVTGLGPTAYRSYAGMTPLAYQRAYWLQPQINSHNNYLDIFAQFGLVGLVIFTWMIAELGRLGINLLGKFGDGFEAGYVRGMLAAGGGALAIMILADWILPFVYNIGFPGFQASVLLWLFLGGLVALGDSAHLEHVIPSDDQDASDLEKPNRSESGPESTR
jgi:O-antigen ligase